MNPTHVEISVKEARKLVYRGKSDTNDAFVTVSLGKDKFQTSVRERATDPVVWNESVTLEIPKQGNTAVITLTVYHRKFIADEVLGTAMIYLKDFQPSTQTKQMIYKLQGRADGKDDKWVIEGEIRVWIRFTEVGLEPRVSRLSLRGKSLWGLADDLIKEKRKAEAVALKRTTSIRSIALALMSEKKKATTPVNVKEYELEMTDTDDNDNLIGVQSARGKTNYNSSDRDRLTVHHDAYQGGMSTDSAASSTELLFEKSTTNTPTRERRNSRSRKLSNISESASSQALYRLSDFGRKPELARFHSETDLGTRIKPPPQVCITTPAQSHGIQEDNDEEVPIEFRRKTKMALVKIILNLQEMTKLQEERIQDLEAYIDLRLAKIMDKDPMPVALQAHRASQP